MGKYLCNDCGLNLHLLYLYHVWIISNFLLCFESIVKTYELRGKTKSELLSTLDDLKRELSEVCY